MRLFFVMFISLVFTPAFAVEEFSPSQKKVIETIIHDYLVKNPDVLKESFQALEKQQAEQQSIAQKQALVEYAGLLKDSKNHAVIGNPKGDVTLVEFFDYNCGYCRASDADLQRLIKEDPDLRVVLKEYPVLGTGSIEAALVSAQLIHEPKYEAFHHTLLTQKGAVDKIRALEVAKSFGFDAKKLEDGMQETAARAPIEESYKLANALGINGTPGYVVGDVVHIGAPGYEVLKKDIEALRAKSADLPTSAIKAK